MAGSFFNWSTPPVPAVAPLYSVLGATGKFAAETLTWPAGTQAGDLALLYGCGNDDIAPAGWNTILGVDFSSISGDCYAWKVLTSTDLAGNPPQTVPSFGHVILTTFHGPNAVRLGNYGSVSASNSSTIPGFTKAQNSVYVLAIQSDRDPATPADWTYPSGYTGIYAGYSTYFGSRVSYIPSASYTSGTNITVPLFASSYGGAGTAIEIYKV